MAQSHPELGISIDIPVLGPVTTSSDITDCRCGVYQSVPRHSSIGISVSLPLVSRFRLRFDPKYQRVGITETASGEVFEGGVGSPVGIVVSRTATTGDRWLVPVFLEQEISRHMRVGLGPQFSLITGSGSAFDLRNPFAPEMSGTVIHVHPVSSPLFGIGAFVEFPFRLAGLLIAPRLNYHHWTGKHYGGNWSPNEVSAGIVLRYVFSR